ncbi:carbon-nitrogen hydrolase family protein [Sulfurimonas sp. HSL1-6]|uniref:carbon-nitrogen hydrolase family protein n=1 Tax=Thiomicrolovo immobilis TaxID=3131935 RepID=UPI0031F82A6E
MTLGVLQLPSVGMSTTKLYHYVRIAHKRGVRVLLMGEYLLNSFFKELQQTPVSMLRELCDHQLGILRDLAATYDMTFVAPLVTVKGGTPFKSIVKVSPRSTAYYQQQVLIDYPHWNEAAFFGNPVETLHEPLTFRVDNVRFGILGGYELHFDALWQSIWEKRIDCILLPTASTFESQQRWRELIKMRAFTHNCFVLRANRIGDVKDDGHLWRFYGDSLLANPDGEIESTLGDTEELMVVEIDHAQVMESRRGWKFKEAVEKRRE